MHSDEQLLEDLKAGGHEAFNQIYKRYWKILYRISFRLTGDKSLSEDLLQELFTKLWDRRLSIKVQDLAFYLKASIRNNSLKSIAKGKVSEAFYKTLDALNAEAASSDAPLIEKELYDAYEAVLNSFPPKRRNIFKLRFEEELPTNRIAEQLGISQKTVQNQLLRSYAVIQTLLSMLVAVFFNRY